MTFTSAAQANSKTAEFARLFDLFDRIATRRARALTGDTSEVISADDIANVPTEFAPVLKNLSTVLSLRARREEERARCAQAVAVTTQPQNTTADAPSTTLAAGNPMPRVEPTNSNQVEDTEAPTFPLGERYPFTFKLMLHKLYDLDEWAEKVKDAVETSKSRFKPLAERVENIVGDAAASVSNKERGEKRNSVRPALGVSAKFRPPSATRQAYPHSGAMSSSRDGTASVKERGERRGSIRPTLGASAKFKPPNTTRHPHSAAMPSIPKQEASRALKKRCIGRRKSINGPMSTGVWVYDAAISAAVTEVAGRRPAVEITLSAPRAGGADGVVEGRARHRSLTALEDVHTRGTARRKVRITVSILEEAAESVLQKASSFSQEVSETKSVVKKRRSVASSFASESCKMVKRPLCV